MTGMMAILTSMKPTVVPAVVSAAVTSGLVLQYDPANPASYSGSGTAVTDLSGLGYTGTLINSPTFDAVQGGGSWVMDGVNDYLLTSNLVTQFNTGNGSVTVEVWCRPTDTAGRSVLAELGGPGGIPPPAEWFDNQIEVGPVGPFFTARAGVWSSLGVVYGGMGTTNPAVNTWTQLVLRYAPNAVQSAKDGVLISTPTAVTRSAPWPTNGLYYGIGAHSSTTLNLASGYFKGNIGIVRIYNRQLTAAEVLQNYNANKARYGL